MRFLTLALLLLVSILTAPAWGQEYFVSGDDQTLWMLRSRQQEGKDASARMQVYDLLAKGQSGKWTWVSREATGQVQTLLAAGESAHVFFSMGEQLVYNLDLRSGTVGSAIVGNALGGCPDTGLQPADAISGTGLVVLTWQQMSAAQSKSSPATATAPSVPSFDLSPRGQGPATAEATLPAITSAPATSQAATRRAVQMVRLTAQRSAGSQWRVLGTLDHLLLSTEVRVFAAVHGGRLHVLISDWPGKRNRLLVLEDGQWRELPLTARADNVSLLASPAIGMFSVNGKLIILLQEDVGEQRQVRMAWAPDAVGEFSWQAMAQRGKGPTTWPAGSKLSPAIMGNQIMLLSQRPAAPGAAAALPELFVFDLDGGLLSFGEIEALDRPGPSELSEQVMQYFLWTVMGLIFFTLFFVRPSGPPKPFALPETVLPANLLVRAMAALMDISPFAAISWAIFQPSVPEGGLETMIREQSLASEWLYFSVCLLSMYVLYGIIMEFYFSATVGKMVCRLRVVGDEARRPNLREVALRNLVKIVELSWPIGLPLLLVLPVLNRNRQRLGDMLARTAVVSAGTLVELPPGPAEPPLPEE